LQLDGVHDVERKLLYIRRGEAYLSFDRPDLAISDFTRAIELGSEEWTTYAGRAIAYTRAGAYNLAVSEFHTVADLIPSGSFNNVLLFYRGAAFLGAGAYQAAIYDLQQIPPHHEAYQQAQDFIRRATDKLAELDTPADVAENESSETALNQGLQAYSEQDYQSAIEAFNRAIEQNPQNPDVYSFRGSAHFYLEEHLEAVQDFDRVLALDTERLDSYVKGAEDEELDQLISNINLLVNLTPGIGTFKGWIEAIIGEDIITGESLAGWERLLSIVPIPGLRQGIDAASDVVTRFPRRIDYSNDFDRDIVDDFTQHELFRGELTEDLELVQYFDGNQILGTNRSAKYWTSPEQANQMSTIDDVREQLALIPEWGERNTMGMAKIPKGTSVEFAVGAAAPQPSNLLGRTLSGGGTQYRFKDFDSDWIIDTREIPE
jgi:tetratricopeptide (TPR) repeat protein